MGNTQPLIRHVSDTALLTAMFRALETERADAAFRDPLARQLAGERGARIIEAMPPEELRNAWAWTTRTYLFDQFVIGAVRDGVDTVVNLAAGLDTRPYRMELPPALRWIEVDLPDLLAYKEDRLKGERPRCALERIRLDLTDRDARREWIDRLGHTTRDVLVLTEGLLIYLDRGDVAALAEDLKRAESFRQWVLDVASPGLLRMIQRQQFGESVSQAGAPLKFAPPEGPEFFLSHGWRPVDVRSTLKTAARLGRLTMRLRFFSLLPESKGRQGSRPWSGVCLMQRTR